MFAMKEISAKLNIAQIGDSEFESDLIFTALIGIMDRIRKDAKQTLETLNEAEIKVIILTGDDLQTANAFARELQFLPQEEHAHAMTNVFELNSS